MGPILDVLADEREHLDEDIQEAVARHFRLTSAERAVLLKNKTTPRYKNRTAWGLVYLQDPKHLPDTRPYIEKIDVRSGHEVYKITRAGARAHRDHMLEAD